MTTPPEPPTTRGAKRSDEEQAVYDFGRKCRRQRLTSRQTDLAVARKWGIRDDLLDAGTDGWNDEDDAATPAVTAPYRMGKPAHDR